MRLDETQTLRASEDARSKQPIGMGGPPISSQLMCLALCKLYMPGLLDIQPAEDAHKQLE